MPSRDRENEGLFERIDRRASERDAKWASIHADNLSEFNPLDDWRSRTGRQDQPGVVTADMHDRDLRAQAASHVRKVMAEGSRAYPPANRPAIGQRHVTKPQRTHAQPSLEYAALQYEGATSTMILLRDSEGFRRGIRIASIDDLRERTLGVQMILHNGETILVVGTSYDALSDVIDGRM
ncbi:hypothetical protein [Azospirillum brasilense]|uniref:hypothetical protein n=1 Tax=Azospirillum brasilense TaxID=192 RepID=UPI0011ECDE58|nr:hypothetical protein [Azospirillum brasilense]